jgi:hypothetical protein
MKLKLLEIAYFNLKSFVACLSLPLQVNQIDTLKVYHLQHSSASVQCSMAISEPI